MFDRFTIHYKLKALSNYIVLGQSDNDYKRQRKKHIEKIVYFLVE